MIREPLRAAGYRHERHFRWRGTEVSRIEGFSDAVFGFALTLLVVSLEVPRRFEDLQLLVWDLPAFAICFLILFVIWDGHYRFCRRYGLADAATRFLTAVLLFLVLFYVYPLKFLWKFLCGQVLLISGWMPESVAQTIAERTRAMVTEPQAAQMMILYGTGYCAVMLTFALLCRHAGRRAAELELDAVEDYLTRWAMRHHLLHAAVAVLSIAVAVRGNPGLSGYCYFLLFPVSYGYGMRMERVLRRLGSRGIVKAAEFRAFALALPDAVEGAHHGHADFRVQGRIFASLTGDERRGMVQLDPAEQALLCAAEPEVYEPAAGAWGRAGSTMVHLESARAAVRRALGSAHARAAATRSARRRRSKPRG